MLDLEEKININKKEEENRQGYLDCLVKGGELYQEHWKEECIRLGKKIDSSGWSCSLPKDIADSLNNSLKEGRDFCKEYYKQ